MAQPQCDENLVRQIEREMEVDPYSAAMAITAAALEIAARESGAMSEGELGILRAVADCMVVLDPNCRIDI